MTTQQNKDMTLKFMRKITNLHGFLKQMSFSEKSHQGLFKEDW